MKTRTISILAAAALFLTGGCTSTSITPAQINAAESQAAPVIDALEKNSKYGSDIALGWEVLTDLTSNTTTSPATPAVLSALPAGTSTGSAQAAVVTALAVLGTPGAPAAARNGTLRQFVRTHRIAPAKMRLYSVNGEAIPSLVP